MANVVQKLKVDELEYRAAKPTTYSAIADFPAAASSTGMMVGLSSPSSLWFSNGSGWSPVTYGQWNIVGERLGYAVAGAAASATANYADYTAAGNPIVSFDSLQGSLFTVSAATGLFTPNSTDDVGSYYVDVRGNGYWSTVPTGAGTVYLALLNKTDATVAGVISRSYASVASAANSNIALEISGKGTFALANGKDYQLAVTQSTTAGVFTLANLDVLISRVPA